MSGTRRQSSTLAALGAGLLLALAPASAQAATTIGQSPPSSGTPAVCNSGNVLLDAVQFTAAGNSYLVPPGGGVITSWRTSLTAGSAQMRLRVFSGDTTAITPLGESALETITAGGQAQFPTRVPVAGGELVGFSISSGPGTEGCLNATTGSAADTGGTAAGSGPIGQSEPVGATGSNILFNVAANLEPDADKDGFGDETQDLCSFSATTQASCTCQGKAATIVGTDNPDTIKGTFAKDVILTFGGDDVAKGRGGNDLICGGTGRDELNGGDGSDKLFGEAGRDKLVGGGKTDTCNGGASKDKSSGCEKGPDS